MNTVLACIACSVVAVATAFDLKTGRIPSWLTWGLVGLALPLRTLLSFALGSPLALQFLLMDGLAGLLVCSAVPLLLWKLGALGGADVKLFGALGATLGVRPGIDVQLLAFVATALVAPVLLAYRGQLVASLLELVRVSFNPLLPRRWRSSAGPGLTTRLPMSPAIFVATAVVLATAWGQHAP